MQYQLRPQSTMPLDQLKALAGRLGISELFCKLLVNRGMSEEEMRRYLSPSLDDLMSPFEIDGMREAVTRIKQAIDRHEKVLIYGDYDCDGISAISILLLALRGKADISYFIPDRNRDGYGVSISAINMLLSQKKPDLVITVDCGITAANEVEYLKSKGVDVIVTDHHEPQDVLPNCIVVDPKIKKRGFFELCGAGVALMLVEAVFGRAESEKYLDIAAIATVADVVPLREDNRVIAHYGLKMINSRPRKGIKLLVGEDKVTSQDIMFRLAPRINAAGRLGSATKVVNLFTDDDYFLLKTLSDELSRDNALRQEMCERAVEEAKVMLRGQDFSKLGLIALYSETWEAGILGIAAARLVEEFKRPAILFSKTGDMLKGSARSIPAVNIFELFASVSDCFTSFGGHAQAAGASMRISDFDRFKTTVNQAVLDIGCDFAPPAVVELELPKNANFLSFAKELQRMEPTGYSNPKPTFLLDGSQLKFESIGISPHVKCASGGLDILGFSKFGDKLSCRLKSATLEVTLDVNTFQNNETAQAVIRSTSIAEAGISDEDADKLNVWQLAYDGEPDDIEAVDFVALRDAAEQKFGALFICFRQSEYDALCENVAGIRSLPLYVGAPGCLNPETCVVLCPSPQLDASFFRSVIIAGNPPSRGYIAELGKIAKTYVLQGMSVSSPKISDSTLRAIYKELAGLAARRERPGTLRKIYLAVCSRYKTSEATFLIALQIFKELDLVTIGDRSLVSASRKSVKLDNSATYRNLNHSD